MWLPNLVLDLINYTLCAASGSKMVTAARVLSVYWTFDQMGLLLKKIHIRVSKDLMGCKPLLCEPSK